MDSITIPSALVVPTSEKHLTPAMVTALWVIGDELDTKRVPANVKESVWLKIPSRRLRGENSRNDNVWLRECLDRLTGIKIGGEYRGDPWGAVVIAEWHIEQGGAVTRILIPPAAVHAIRAPSTFAKIESFAAYKLQGAARRLYATLADKKRMSKPYWIYGVDELRDILGVREKKSYQRWNNFRQWILDPAIEQINDFGTVTIKMTPQKVGRAIGAIRFDWKWKSIDEARETNEENTKPSIARRKNATVRDAPPLSNVMHPVSVELAKVVTPQIWESWFENCKFLNTDDGSLEIHSPTQFFASHIKENFESEIVTACAKCDFSGNIKILPL